MERIGLVGAGLMGRGIARNLIKAGHPLTFHVRRERAETAALIELGASQTKDLLALAADSEVIVLCVDHADTVRTVTAGLWPGLRAGQLVIDATTSKPEVSREVAAMLEKIGVDYADVPMTGGPVEAEAGRVGSIVGCEAASFARIEKIVSCYSASVQRVGGVGTGHTAKLLNNFVSQGAVVLLAEAYGRARDAGVDWRALYALMSAGAARSGTLEKMVKPALDGNYDGSKFSIRNSHKDLSYFCELAAASERGPSALAEAIRHVLDGAIAENLGDRYVGVLLDPEASSALLRGKAPSAGVCNFQTT
jgi:3-hydroxyisobutyrate dehydrogenase-like beta-hydroxyacid dehydrogenase